MVLWVMPRPAKQAFLPNLSPPRILREGGGHVIPLRKQEDEAKKCWFSAHGLRKWGQTAGLARGGASEILEFQNFSYMVALLKSESQRIYCEFLASIVFSSTKLGLVIWKSSSLIFVAHFWDSQPENQATFSESRMHYFCIWCRYCKIYSLVSWVNFPCNLTQLTGLHHIRWGSIGPADIACCIVISKKRINIGAAI